MLGQDGAYLARLLVGRGYRVVGLDHGGDAWRLRRLGIDGAVQRVEADLRDSERLQVLLREHRPTEVYNLAARSSVRRSFESPLETAEVTAMGALRLLEAVRAECPDVRFYQASSSEMFGRGAPAPQNETTPFAPSSPYAVAKVYAHQMTVAYREAYGLFACCGILFTHESPLRGDEFVTRKIVRSAVAIAAGREERIRLGNLAARRDFGYAPEYVEAMWRMLQQDEAGDYVIATGTAHSIREFAEAVFTACGLALDAHLESDASLLRPSDLDLVQGDPTRAKERLGWQAKTGFGELVELLVAAEREGTRHA